MNELPVVSLRMVQDKTVSYRRRKLRESVQVYKLFRPILNEMDREAVWVACLDTKLSVTCLSQVSLGTLNSSSVHPREVFKVALLANAHAIVVAHNHPSGDPAPSVDDKLVTDQLRRCGKLMGIELKDHVIIGRESYYSFADEGRL